MDCRGGNAEPGGFNSTNISGSNSILRSYLQSKLSALSSDGDQPPQPAAWSIQTNNSNEKKISGFVETWLWNNRRPTQYPILERPSVAKKTNYKETNFCNLPNKEHQAQVSSCEMKTSTMSSNVLPSIPLNQNQKWTIFVELHDSARTADNIKQLRLHIM